ncbi:MAG: hypothetical protein ACHQRM_01190 [Bacteroidia bacterium]
MLRLHNILLINLLCLLLGSSCIKAGNDKEPTQIKREFHISQLKLDSAGKINWLVFNQNGPLEFGIEQFQNEHWVMIGLVAGDAKVDQIPYSYSPHMNSGENRYRIFWDSPNKVRSYSNIVSTVSKKEDVYFLLASDNLTVTFTSSTYYIVYNPYGFIIARGLGDKIDISEYKPGMYCVTYDNKVATFEKKQVWFKNSRHPVVRENKPEHIKKGKKPFEMSPP